MECVVLRAHAGEGDADVADLRASGFDAYVTTLDSPVLESAVALLSRRPAPVGVDLSGGPPILTQACQYAAQLLRIPHYVRTPFGFRLDFPMLPTRHPPPAWRSILEALTASPSPCPVRDLSRETGLSESTVRYHILGRGAYDGLVACGFVAAHRGVVRVLPLGRAALTSGILERSGAEAGAPSAPPSFGPGAPAPSSGT